ncbi:testis-expressed protein 22 [Arvicola amphibius]|uniref:testis-expressed protein 22 n=1 Tax=Arvicola amphibius TaxID=1047088 RepID=UPI0018E39AFA|nr:testis-expressed protein 22 [Arvicola amphibius]
MDRQQRPQRKTLQWQLAQEHGHQSPPHGSSSTSSQPDTKNNLQEDLQTQDWVCEPPERRSPGNRWSVSIDERRRLAMLHAQGRTNTARAPSRDILGLQLPVRSTPTSHSQVPEAMVGHPQDLEQMVAELVSEGVERDVLFLHPQHSTVYHNTFQNFLARGTPLWQSENYEAQTSRSPPS